MEACYYAKYHLLEESNAKQAYTIWRKYNLNNRPYIVRNKRANVRRKILKYKRLTDTEVSQIEEAANNIIPERNVEPVLIMENFDNEEIEQIINKIKKGEKIIHRKNKQTKLNKNIISLNQK